MLSKSENVWYFAYGSNMSTEKFTGGRGIKPIASAKVYIPNYTLRMEIPGVPYSEPSYGSIRERDDADTEKAIAPDVIGVAYLLTAEQYRQVIASEGGQIAYQDIAVSAKPVGEDDEVRLGASKVTVRTLGSTTMVRRPEPAPSKRYMVSCDWFYHLSETYRFARAEDICQDLLMTGAEEAHLPVEYRKYLAGLPRYNPPSGKWTKLGAFIFLALVRPVWLLLDKITHNNTGADGNVPAHIVWLVRSVIFVIWLFHDWVFAPVFGRGDGLDGKQQIEMGILGEREEIECHNEKINTLYGTM